MTPFGQQMQVTIRANLPDSVIKLHDQATKYLSDEDYHAALMLCSNEIERLKASLGDDFDKYVIPVHRTLYAIFKFTIKDYEEAIEILDGILSDQEKAFGKKHPILGSTLNNLATVHYAEDNFVEVGTLARRALDIYDQSICHEYLGLADKLIELALYFENRSYRESERCYSRALRIYEANLSPDDPRVANASNKLGRCYLLLGKSKDAEVIFKKVLSRAYEKEFGDEDCGDAGDNSSWLQLLAPKIVFGHATTRNKHAINIWQTAEERERGKDKLTEEISPPVWYKPINFASPTFNAALSNLAHLYECQGKDVAAKTLRDFEDQYPELPETRVERSVQNLSAKPSSAEENEPSCATVPQTRIMVPPSAPPVSADEQGGLSRGTTSQIRSSSPSSAMSRFVQHVTTDNEVPTRLCKLHNLLIQYASQECRDRYEITMPLCHQTLDGIETSSPNQPDIATMLNTLGLFYQDQKRYDKAIDLLKDALAIRERTLGGDHPAVAATLNNLAVAYGHRGFSRDQLNEAESLCSRALNIREKVLGRDHLDVAKVLNNLASLCKSCGKYDESERNFERAIEIYEANFAPIDPNVVKTKNNLAACYLMQRRQEDAEGLYKQILTEAHEWEFGAVDDDNKPIWQLAEEMSEDDKYDFKSIVFHSKHKGWHKAKKVDSSIFCDTVRELKFMYRHRRKYETAKLLEDYENWLRRKKPATSTQAKVESSISPCPPLAPIVALIPTSPLAKTRHDEETKTSENIEKKIIAELQAEIAEKTRRLAEAERALETHGAFCCICLDEVANRMWSGCNHLAACSECAETLLRTEENRSSDGIACPKCRTHGRPLPAFI